MDDVQKYLAVALAIIVFLAGGVIALALRRRLTRLLPFIDGEVGDYEERTDALAQAIKLLRIRTPHAYGQDEDVLVSLKVRLWLRRSLIVAVCMFSLSGLLTIGAAIAMIVSKQINIEYGLGKILYDLFIAVVSGSVIGIVTGLFVDHIIKRREQIRWRSVRRLYYVSISRILGRLLNEAVPDDQKKYQGSTAGSKLINLNRVNTDFEPMSPSIFCGFLPWQDTVGDILGRGSPLQNSEPLLLVEPLGRAIEAFEKLFQMYGPVGDPELAKLIGDWVRMSMQFNDFARSGADWKHLHVVQEYCLHVVILLRLAYELREKILATGEVTALHLRIRGTRVKSAALSRK